MNTTLFIKKINDEIVKTDFRTIRPEENFRRTITFLPKELSRQEMNVIASNIYLQNTNADICLQQVTNSMPQGEIQYHQLWDIFPYNNEIAALKLETKWLEQNFEISGALFSKDSLLTATSYYHALRICEYLSIPETKIIPSGSKEIPALETYLQERGEISDLNHAEIVQGIAYVNVFVDDFKKIIASIMMYWD